MEYYKLVGYKHIAGTSKKNGKPYDGYSLHVLSKPAYSVDFVGEETWSLFVDRAMVENDYGFAYQIGDLLDIRYDNRGRVVGVTYGG